MAAKIALKGGDLAANGFAFTLAGARARYPDGVPADVHAQLDRELALIGELDYGGYFLTMHEIVEFCRAEHILCQGRGSAANSAVCYCLGITSIDPVRMDFLFERFLSRERAEPPDIDLDIEHERREEVIQRIYEKYGRDRAGLAATVITYRTRSAVREVGKAMGLSEDVVSALAKTSWGIVDEGVARREVEGLGLSPDDPTIRMTLALTRELLGFPRHLSQHPGGFEDHFSHSTPPGGPVMISLGSPWRAESGIRTLDPWTPPLAMIPSAGPRTPREIAERGRAQAAHTVRPVGGREPTQRPPDVPHAPPEAAPGRGAEAAGRPGRPPRGGSIRSA